MVAFVYLYLNMLLFGLSLDNDSMSLSTHLASLKQLDNLSNTDLGLYHMETISSKTRQTCVCHRALVADKLARILTFVSLLIASPMFSFLTPIKVYVTPTQIE